MEGEIMIDMTMAEAKKDLKRILAQHGIEYSRITGKTVSFMDLARDSRMFLTVHGVVWPSYVQEGELIVADENTVAAGRNKPAPYSIEWRRLP